MQRNNANLDFGVLSKRTKTRNIFTHHAAGKGLSVEDIHKMHLARGWSGIGYHIYVRLDGSVWNGRPLDAIGAHASGSNSDSVAVCFEGNFEVEQMPEVQKEAGKAVIAYLKELYNIDTVRAHREVNATACPGRYFPFAEIAGAVNTENEVEEAVVEDSLANKDIIQAGQIHANNFAGLDIKVDGIRGPETKAAGIMVLQTAINLDYDNFIQIDGLWQDESKSALGYHYVKHGETQYLVTAAKILLMLKGYAVPTVESPSVFDDDLEFIVKMYQRDHGLTEDGIVGYYTFMSLIS